MEKEEREGETMGWFDEAERVREGERDKDREALDSACYQ